MAELLVKTVASGAILKNEKIQSLPMADGFALDVGFKLSKADRYGKRLNRGSL